MGTWDLDNEYGWWRKDSAFAQYAFNENVVLYPRQPFIWSSDIDGVIDLFGRAKDTDWRAAGASLAYYLETIQHSHRNLIAHSHGMQVVACACFYFGIEIRNLITVGSPVRKDFYNQYAAVQNKSNRWLHIYDKDFDIFGQLGMLFDGSISFKRENPYASKNAGLVNISHTTILEDKDKFKLWIENGWFDYLR